MNICYVIPAIAKDKTLKKRAQCINIVDVLKKQDSLKELLNFSLILLTFISYKSKNKGHVLASLILASLILAISSYHRSYSSGRVCIDKAVD